eukprot:6174383-Pleurochrysis_carterae.AAC.2
MQSALSAARDLGSQFSARPVLPPSASLLLSLSLPPLSPSEFSSSERAQMRSCAHESTHNLLKACAHVHGRVNAKVLECTDARTPPRRRRHRLTVDLSAVIARDAGAACVCPRVALFQPRSPNLESGPPGLRNQQPALLQLGRGARARERSSAED